MSKEIREGIDSIVCDCCDEDVEGCRKVTCAYATDMRDLIIKYLDSRDVVLKVEGELPEYHRGKDATCLESCHMFEQYNMLKAGYTKTRRLI